MRTTFWLWLGVGAAVGLGAGAAALALTPAVYAAQASVLVESVGPDVNLRTEAELVRSTQTASGLAGSPVRRADRRRGDRGHVGAGHHV